MGSKAEEIQYDKLADAIVLQAVKDYRALLRKWKKNINNREIMRELSKIEKFFRSEWYLLLTNVDPEFLIEKLRKEIGQSE